MKRRNRKLRKALLMTCCALALVAISVGATLAYLTDSEGVTNVFTVGQVGISLDEAPVDGNGKKITGDRVKENEYHLIPGKTYDKDPTVTLDAKSEPSYVRMLVTVADYSDLLAVCKKHSSEGYVQNDVVLLQNFTDWTEESPWDYYAAGFKRDTASDTATYEFRYNAITVKADAEQSLAPLFTTITLPGWMDNADLQVLGAGYKANLGGSTNAFGVTADAGEKALEINVAAHAIQAAGFDSAADAWAAFNTQMNN